VETRDHAELPALEILRYKKRQIMRTFMPLAKVVHITSEELGLYSTPAGMSGNSSARLLMACG